MSIYSAALFVHIVSAMVLAAAFRLEILTLIRLRKATSPAEAQFVMDLAPGFPVVAFVALLLLLLSGGYMTAMASAWSLAWPKVALVTMVLIGPLGAASGRKMREIRRLSSPSQSSDSELLKKLQDPFLPLSIVLRVALVLGIVLLMTAKPGMAESFEAIGIFAFIGVVAGLVFSRRGAVSPAVGAGSRS